MKNANFYDKYYKPGKTVRVSELIPFTQKSFYGKAIVITVDNNIFLQSYDTIVCGFVNGEFERYWNNYSATTMKHINDFLRMCTTAETYKNIGGKKWWNNQPVVECKF